MKYTAQAQNKWEIFSCIDIKQTDIHQLMINRQLLKTDISIHRWTNNINIYLTAMQH